MGKRKYSGKSGSSKKRKISSKKHHGLKPELKYVDKLNEVLTCTSDNDTNKTVVLNKIAEGTSAITRIGRKVSIKSVDIRFLLRPQPTATDLDFVRCMLVWDKQPTEAVTEVKPGDILNEVEVGAYMDLDKRTRYRVLRDELYPVGKVGDGANPHLGNRWYVRFPGSGLETTYKAATNDYTSIQMGSLFFLTFSERTAAQGDAPTCKITARTRYYDN